MNVTLSLDDKLVKEVRKIAVERDTTLTSLIREYLEKLAAESAVSGRKRREVEDPVTGREVRRETRERAGERDQRFGHAEPEARRRRGVLVQFEHRDISGLR